MLRNVQIGSRERAHSLMGSGGCDRGGSTIPRNQGESLRHAEEFDVERNNLRKSETLLIFGDQKKAAIPLRPLEGLAEWTVEAGFNG